MVDHLIKGHSITHRVLAGGGFNPVIAYLECNFPPTGTTTEEPLTFDSFYDEESISIGSLPAGLGLTTADNQHFEATERIVVILALGISTQDITPDSGVIELGHPAFIDNPRWHITGVTSLPDTDADQAIKEITIPMQTGEQFRVRQISDGGPVTLISYADMSIIRIA